MVMRLGPGIAPPSSGFYRDLFIVLAAFAIRDLLQKINPAWLGARLPRYRGVVK